MSSEPARGADAAWVVVNTPLEAEPLSAFCRDVERLFRINPYLEFEYWRTADGHIETAFRNLSNGRHYALKLTLEARSADEFLVRYDRGLKRLTRFQIEPAPAGARLVITDDYTGAGADADTAEVDRSLHAWGVALHDYLRREARWGRHAIWRWYMRRVWLPMKPSARRITFMLLIITLAEIALIALVMGIYWAERWR